MAVKKCRAAVILFVYVALYEVACVVEFSLCERKLLLIFRPLQYTTPAKAPCQAIKYYGLGVTLPHSLLLYHIETLLLLVASIIELRVSIRLTLSQVEFNTISSSISNSVSK